MLIEESPKGLRLLVSPDEEAELAAMPQEERDSDAAMYEFLGDNLLPDCDLEWISAEDIGALTDDPILGRTNEEGNAIDVFVFTDAALRSVLGDLAETGEAFFERG